MTTKQTLTYTTLAVLLYFAGHLSAVQQARSNQVTCRPGTHSAEDGSCVAEPTGCPYGDTIPLDECDKHKPQGPEKIEIQVIKPKVTLTPCKQ